MQNGRNLGTLRTRLELRYPQPQRANLGLSGHGRRLRAGRFSVARKFSEPPSSEESRRGLSP